jgi:hypothetical protein
VAIDSCSVVTDTALFVHSTLEQLRTALAEPELIDRLAQVGLVVLLESTEKPYERPDRETRMKNHSETGSGTRAPQKGSKGGDPICASPTSLRFRLTKRIQVNFMFPR